MILNEHIHTFNTDGLELLTKIHHPSFIHKHTYFYAFIVLNYDGVDDGEGFHKKKSHAA